MLNNEATTTVDVMVRPAPTPAAILQATADDDVHIVTAAAVLVAPTREREV
jgi:hypothetical protein